MAIESSTERQSRTVELTESVIGVEYGREVLLATIKGLIEDGVVRKDLVLNILDLNNAFRNDSTVLRKFMEKGVPAGTINRGVHAEIQYLTRELKAQEVVGGNNG